MDLLIIFLVVFATARLTRLVVDDVITQPLRDRLAGRAARGGKLAGWFEQLTSCSWCTSVWVAAGVVGLAYSLPAALFLWPALALTASHLVGLLDTFEGYLIENSGHNHQ